MASHSALIQFHPYLKKKSVGSFFLHVVVRDVGSVSQQARTQLLASLAAKPALRKRFKVPATGLAGFGFGVSGLFSFIFSSKKKRKESVLECFMLFLFYFILFYFILFYFILFYFILFYFILFYFILFYFILFYFILFYFILFYFILFYFILLF